MTRIRGLAANAAFSLGMKLCAAQLWRPFQAALHQPAQVQARLLEQILKENAETAFGRGNRFRCISHPREFRDAVPVQTHDSLEPLITEQAETGAKILTSGSPVFYARTSGTTGAAKLTPMTARGLRGLADMQRLFALAQYRYTDSFAGRILAIGGAALEDRTARGTPIGAATGVIYAAMPAAVRHRYVAPPELFAVADYDQRNYLIALLAVATPDLSCLATANPSTLLRMLHLIEANWDRLLDDLQGGASSALEALTDPQRRAIGSRLYADPERARMLRRAGLQGPAGWSTLWPGLKAIVTWTGGSCGYALKGLRMALAPEIALIEAGYQASECRGAVNIDPRQNICVPAITETYFEFVERAAREGGAGGPFLSLEELEEGGEYYVYVTTRDGLYRYDMNDILRVTGRVAETPALAFVQKGSGVTNITGEKLTESQAVGAVEAVVASRGLGAPFFLLLADEENAVYRLIIELRNGRAGGLADEIDRVLMRSNIEYAAKRRSGRLQPAEVVLAKPGAGEAYRRHCILKGQRDAQFKVVHLQYARQVDFDFRPFGRDEP